MSSTDCLPFERFATKYLLRDHLHAIIYWFFAEVLLLIPLLRFAEGGTWALTLQKFGVPAVMAVMSINGNLFFLLYLSKRIRSLSPFIERITENKTLYQEIYRHSRVYAAAIIFLVSGYATFGALGLRANSLTAIIIYGVLLFVLGLGGMSAGAVMNLWRFFFLLGRQKIKIDVTHSDRMGGLKPIGDLNAALLYIGAILIAVYSVGAQFAPYARGDLRKYAYLWVVAALGFFALGIFVPTYTIHQLLQVAKDEQENHLSKLKAQLLRSFEFTLEETPRASNSLGDLKNALESVKYFETDLERMTTWPYENMWKMLGRVVSIQAVASLIGSWETVTKVVAKLTH
jgi:hypothetical protein